MGSACEVEYQLLLSFDLNYIEETKYNELLDNIIEIKQMLTSFIKKLKTENFSHSWNIFCLYINVVNCVEKYNTYVT